MRCPQCGAITGDDARTCPRCGNPLAQDSLENNTITSGPPPLAPEGAPPPPGRLAPAGGREEPFPPREERKRSNLLRILLGVLAALGILGVVFLVIVVTVEKEEKIRVPVPAGWQEADQKTMESFQKASSQGGQVTVDYLFTDGSPSNFIAVAHGNAYITERPEDDDLATVQDFFARHKTELLDQLQAVYRQANASVEVRAYEVRMMACGTPALHLDLVATMGGLSLEQYFLFFFRGGTMYFALVNKLGGQGVGEEIGFLTENISFE